MIPNKKKSILLVDDNVPLLTTIALEFSDKDYEVFTATSHAEAVAHIQNAPEFAVIDIRIGGDKGLHVLRDLMEAIPSLIAVMLTGHGSIASAVNAIKLGARNYITKPCTIESIENALFQTDADPDAESDPLHSLARHEQEYIESILAACDGNVSEAARRLSLHRQSLQRKLKRSPPKN
jgi:two-component system response regulator RegA